MGIVWFGNVKVISLVFSFCPYIQNNPPRRKKKAKAKKSKPETGTETTNKITNYFGGTAAANKTPDPP